MESEIEEIVCPICMMVFRRPATISCGHTFCFSCLGNSTRESRSCPICRQHIAHPPSKARLDHSLNAFIEHYRRSVSRREEVKTENAPRECKPERLLLVDVTAEDLLLPFNKSAATFELQSNLLMDRMERFVARQEIPHNSYGVLCRLVQVEELRKNLYRGILEGRAFCSIEGEQVESEMSLEMEEDEFFFRTCHSKEIAETSDTNPSEYSLFFQNYSRLPPTLTPMVATRVDPTILALRNDPIAIFYAILGLLNMDNTAKYQLATTFDEQKRIQGIRRFIESIQGQLRANPSILVRLQSPSVYGDRRFICLLIGLLLIFLYTNYGHDAASLQ